MNPHAFSETDRAQIEAHGLTLEEAERQLALFRSAQPFARLARPCTRGSGIHVIDGDGFTGDGLTGDGLTGLEQYYEHARRSGRLCKFIPASGAASRMFKSLLAVWNSASEIGLAEWEGRATAGDGEARALMEFLGRLRDFAFWDVLRGGLAARGKDLESLLAEGRYREILGHLLTAKGLDYARQPKGLLPFHRHGDEVRTAFEEHLVEGATYGRDGEGRVRLHFTVSGEHRAGFARLLRERAPAIGARHGASFEITFSEQHPATDTLAVDLDNELFRLEDGSLVFRPGGHGSLIENLNELGADLVLIGNIDNIVSDHLRSVVVQWEKVLVGLLVRVQGEVFERLARLEAESGWEEDLEATLAFAERWLALNPPRAGYPRERAALRDFLRARLDRPIRVCGMVPNEGQPGGGPFWVGDEDGSSSLQIVESAQVNLAEPEQRAIFEQSTHFNPVDLACGLCDRHGQAYDLHRFIDERAVFIAEKSLGGRPLKALERPGLWNGAMARWNTLFVELPIETFAPVKVIHDLLGPAHQPAT